MKSTQQKQIKAMFACPTCSSIRTQDSEECPKCKSSAKSVQIHPTPSVVLSKSDAKQILIAKSMTSGISRLNKGRQHGSMEYDEDMILGY
ncbi:MAG: hypothetical protein LBK70_01825 [Clostridiales bacterium]|jgi:RNA polymerase subunit RPABC4/transcription elongation factor Spt4|nr:hypothetical protein [Clostridiales bacterium]